MRQFILLAILSLLLCSCNNKNEKDIATTINLASNNKTELKKVLDYYRGKDSISYEAAVFLIKNLPHKYSFSDWRIDSLKQLEKESIAKGKINDSILTSWITFDYQQSLKVLDINCITADLLIENIDYSLKAWREHKWSKFYSFEDFCEYVLPYRIGDEPLEKWRKMYYEKYNSILDSLYQGTDAVEAARILANYLKQEGFINRTDFQLPHLGPSFLFKNRIGYCRENCDIALYVMRAVGIPVATDFYEISPSYDSRHFWTAIIDTNHHAIPFNYTEDEISRTRREERKKGKIYRICFSKQEKNTYKKEVPFFFKNVHIKDVTEEYFPHTKACIYMPMHKQGNYMYLSIFSKKKYIPIDIAENKNSTYCFQGIEQELIYFPTLNKKGHMQCTTYPFLLSNNSPKFFSPNFTQKEVVLLRRKYPLLKGRDFVKNICGARIEASVTKDFKKATLLYEFKKSSLSNRTVITLKLKRKFRYIRYIAQPQREIELGEFYVYKKGHQQMSSPTQITSSETLDSTHIRDLKLMTDKKWESFYLSRTIGASLTFDYGRSIAIDKIVVIPRNDDNYIHIGDIYELFFHNGKKGWKSLGKQKATSNIIKFTSVPSNALLWLHNHTRGTEERPFYMRNGKQVFP